jgi:hypothetical protein
MLYWIFGLWENIHDYVCFIISDFPVILDGQFTSHYIKLEHCSECRFCYFHAMVVMVIT